MMIRNNILSASTSVDFSREDEPGKVSVNAHYNQLILRELKGEKKIGEKTEADDEKTRKEIVLNFYKTESIDVVIEILQRIKKNIERTNQDQYSFAQAC